MTTFDRTEAAAKTDKQSKWDVIEAIALDAVDADFPITGADSCIAAKEAFERAGDEHADDTIRSLTLVSKIDYESSPKRRKIWRRYGWTCIREVAEAGWSQERAEALLQGVHKTRREIQAKVRTERVPPGVLDINEAWHDVAGKFSALLFDMARLAERTETEGLELDAHSALAYELYHRIAEKQIDAEYRALVEAEAPT